MAEQSLPPSGSGEMLDRHIEELRRRITALHQRAVAFQPREHDLLAEAFQELSTALIELQVADDQLTQWRDALVAERERNRALFDQAPDATLLTDIHGVIRESNRAADELMAADHPISGRTLVSFIPTSGRRTFRAKVQRLVQAAAPREWNVRMRFPDGTAREVSLTATPVTAPDGAVIEIRWLLHDISELQRAREHERLLDRERDAHVRAESQRAYLHAVLEQLPIAVVIAEAPSGRITFANTLTRRLSGSAARPTTIAEYGQFRVFHDDGRPYEPAEIPVARALGGEVVTGEVVDFIHDDGTRHRLRCCAGPIRDTGGRIIAAAATCEDVTGQPPAPREPAAPGWDRLLLGIAHDVSSPLTIIKGTAQMLARQVGGAAEPDGARVTEGLAAITAAVDRVAAMVRELSELARTHGQTPPLHVRPTDLVALVRRIVAGRLPANGRDIRIETGEEWLIGMWDADGLERVLVNLLTNAAIHGREDEKITVRLAREARSAGDTRAVLMVENQGEGIAAEDLPHIFDPFYRGRDAAGTAGSGMGLAVVRQIVEQHGGSVVVTSGEDGVTAFTVRLPGVLP